MSKILIAGCSTSNHCGWKEPAGKVWWHPLSTTYNGQHNITSIARDGNTNHDIMMSVISNTSPVNDYDIIMVQWTSFYKQNFYLSRSLDAQDRVYFGFMPKRPLAASRVALDGSPHKKSLIHWQENFINLRHFYNANLTYFIATATHLLHQKIPFIFLNTIGGGIHFADILTPDWKSTSEAYRNEVLLWPVCGDAEAERGHKEIHEKIITLKALSEPNWVYLNKSFVIKDVPDLADDGFHPGVLASELIRTNVVKVCKQNNYSV